MPFLRWLLGVIFVPLLLGGLAGMAAGLLTLNLELLLFSGAIAGVSYAVVGPLWARHRDEYEAELRRDEAGKREAKAKQAVFERDFNRKKAERRMT